MYAMSKGFIPVHVPKLSIVVLLRGIFVFIQAPNFLQMLSTPPHPVSVNIIDSYVSQGHDLQLPTRTTLLSAVLHTEVCATPPKLSN
jgi:hypothetical protein